jgi:hypothetical protein
VATPVQGKGRNENAMKMPSLEEVKNAMSAPPPEGEVKIMNCMVCGAVTYVRFAGNESGSGDPVLHAKYHADKGEEPNVQ